MGGDKPTELTIVPCTRLPEEELEFELSAFCSAKVSLKPQWTQSNKAPVRETIIRWAIEVLTGICSQTLGGSRWTVALTPISDRSNNKVAFGLREVGLLVPSLVKDQFHHAWVPTCNVRRLGRHSWPLYLGEVPRSALSARLLVYLQDHLDFDINETPLIWEWNKAMVFLPHIRYQVIGVVLHNKKFRSTFFFGHYGIKLKANGVEEYKATRKWDTWSISFVTSCRSLLELRQICSIWIGGISPISLLLLQGQLLQRDPYLRCLTSAGKSLPRPPTERWSGFGG